MAGEEYRRIVRTFWTDPEVKRRLTRDQKLLLLYFCTSPHSNMIGVYYCPLAYVASEVDVPLEDVRKSVAGPLARFLTYDEQTEEVFVHGLAKHNVGVQLKVGKDGPDNRIKCVERLVEAVHSTRLKRAFLARYGSGYHLTLITPDDRQPPSQAPSEPLRSPSEAIAVHSTTEQSNSVPTEPTSREAESIEEADDPTPTEGQVLATVRKVLWAPDGRPPLGWSEGREVSVIRGLVKQGEITDDLVRAVHGIRVLQQQGEVDWLGPGKATLRVVYHSKNGSRDMFTQALDAYASGSRPPERKPKSGQREHDVKRADFIAAAGRIKGGIREPRSFATGG